MAKRLASTVRTTTAPHGESAESPSQPAGLLVYRIAEGLGNASVLIFPDQSLGIVDWGTLDDEPLDDLAGRAAGNRVRFIAASHAHKDHTLGLERLVRRCHAVARSVDSFVYPVLTPTISPKSNRRNALTRAVIAAYQLHIPLHPVMVSALYDEDAHPPALAKDDDWEVRVLAPASGDVGAEEVKAILGGRVAGNATSLVLSFWFRRDASAKRSTGRILLPGDATGKTLEFARDTAMRFDDITLSNQAIVVPHHGGANTLPGWFSESIEGIAVVSAPTASHDLPHVRTLTQLAVIGGRGDASKLFCTSYAGACEQAFKHLATSGQRQLVSPGPCFGHLEVTVPADQPANVATSRAPGQLRRPFGWCGEHAAHHVRGRKAASVPRSAQRRVPRR